MGGLKEAYVSKIIVPLVDNQDKKDMTIKHLFFALILTSATLLGFTSCNDEDYAPIQLETLDGSGKLDNNMLQVDAFSKGESFCIIGGNGRYVIENKSENIIDYRYDGHTLTIIPVGTGQASLVIHDHAGNQMTLSIEVKNPTSFYTVTGLDAEAYGDLMTGGEMKQVKQLMMEESLVKVGGDILFTYTDAEHNQGSVTIHPTPSGRPVSGIFQEKRKFNDQKVPYVEITITLADYREIKWKMLNSTDEAGKEMLLQEEVTNTYKGKFPQLEEAKLTYTITH